MSLRLIFVVFLIAVAPLSARATLPVGDVGGIPKHILQVLLLGTVADPISILGKAAGILSEDLKKLDINTQERDMMRQIMEAYYGEAQALSGADVGDEGSNQDSLITAGIKASDITDQVIQAARKQAQILGMDPSHLNVMEELNNQVIRNLMFVDVVNKLKEAGAGSLTLVQRRALSNQIESLKSDMRNQAAVNELAASLLAAIEDEREATQQRRGYAVMAARGALGLSVDYNVDPGDYGGTTGFKNTTNQNYDFQGSDHMTHEQYLARYGRTSNPNAGPRGGNPGTPGAGNFPPGDGSIANSAYNMIGQSTSAEDTKWGKLGCAVGVSMIFKNATGQSILPGRERVLSTNDLYDGLSSDPRFVKVSLSQAQSGDIVVTARGTQAGHTGVVGNNGEIISNSSSGFAGGAKGTIQQNYTITSWQSKVTPRNPSQTAAFRYIGG